VLGLYAGAVLDDDGAEEQWQAEHPAYPAYMMNISDRARRPSLAGRLVTST
jgi:hypothetical protein